MNLNFEPFIFQKTKNSFILKLLKVLGEQNPQKFYQTKKKNL